MKTLFPSFFALAASTLPSLAHPGHGAATLHHLHGMDLAVVLIVAGFGLAAVAYVTRLLKSKRVKAMAGKRA